MTCIKYNYLIIKCEWYMEYPVLCITGTTVNNLDKNALLTSVKLVLSKYLYLVLIYWPGPLMFNYKYNTPCCLIGSALKFCRSTKIESTWLKRIACNQCVRYQIIVYLSSRFF